MALVKAWVILEVAITHLGRSIRALRLTNASYRMSRAPTPQGETWAKRASRGITSCSLPAYQPLLRGFFILKYNK